MQALLIDTNLLVLFIAGNLDPARVGTHRRLRGFEQLDLDNLNALVRRFPLHISLPNILTEASNLLGSGDQELTTGAAQALATYSQNLDEIYEPSREVTRSPAYMRFGLADTAVIDVARRKAPLVATSEWALHGALETNGMDAVNIYHLRGHYR